MSKLAHTPFRNLRIPQWMMGWLLEESYIRHPKVVTATEIQAKLGINYKTALLMKRRVQLLACEQMPKFRKLIREEMHEQFPDKWRLPPNGENVRRKVKNRKVVHADTLALFSASERANKGRRRHKNRGQTSSIYMAENLGGRQIGTLVHVMGTRGGWCLLDSVPDQKAGTIGPIIRKSLPRNTALFTDEAYTWLYRIYPNHRMVNHSKKSKDKRYRYARDRWCQNGVHNQIAEGLNSSLKMAMRGYAYFRPKYSTMYLNEWVFFKNARYFGVEALGEMDGDHQRWLIKAEERSPDASYAVSFRFRGKTQDGQNGGIDNIGDGRVRQSAATGGRLSELGGDDGGGDNGGGIKQPFLCSINTIEPIRLMLNLAERLSCLAAPHLRLSTHNTIRQSSMTSFPAFIQHNASAVQYATAPCLHALTPLDALPV
tara:strand:+ start:879 stop:2165 length:1287 start_codon:yes stop_codon:yes gene_type:complete